MSRYLVTIRSYDLDPRLASSDWTPTELLEKDFLPRLVASAREHGLEVGWKRHPRAVRRRQKQTPAKSVARALEALHHLLDRVEAWAGGRDCLACGRNRRHGDTGECMNARCDLPKARRILHAAHQNPDGPPHASRQRRDAA